MNTACHVDKALRECSRTKYRTHHSQAWVLSCGIGFADAQLRKRREFGRRDGLGKVPRSVFSRDHDGDIDGIDLVSQRTKCEPSPLSLSSYSYPHRRSASEVDGKARAPAPLLLATSAERCQPDPSCFDDGLPAHQNIGLACLLVSTFCCRRHRHDDHRHAPRLRNISSLSD